jgi:cobalt/nickel transport system permease protein
MISEPFADGVSIIHRIDPRFRIVAAVLFSVVVAVSREIDTLAGALLMAVCLIFAGRLNLLQVAKKYGIIFGFLILIWLLMPFTYPGASIAKIGPLTATRAGVNFALTISLKSTAIVLSLMSLIATIPMATLGHALYELRMPGKIVHLLLMTYRYIHVIEWEYQRLIRAAKIRGFKPGTNFHTYKTTAYFVGVLFIRAVERADRVSKAMKCRGFNGQFYCLTEFPAHSRNWIFAWVAAACILGLIYLEWLTLLF